MSTRWYDRGADAFARVVDGLPRGYVCPLCLRLFTPDRINELTVDHVPAEQMGGNRLILTCRRCNSESGAFLQGEMRKQENPVAALRGELDQPHPVRMTLSTGATIHAELSGQPGSGYRLNVIEAADSEAAREAFKEDMGRMTADGSNDWSLNLDFYRDRHHPVAARVGWLREAFLVGFAVLGYRYILDAALSRVREQLAQPREELITSYQIVSPEKPPDQKAFLMITEPEWLRSVAVQFGRRIVFLPRIGDPGIYDRLSERRRISSGDRLDEVHAEGGTVDAWPREPLFLMDFQLPSPVFRVLTSTTPLTPGRDV